MGCTRVLFLCLLALSVGNTVLADNGNEKIGDVMMMMVDQSSGLASVIVAQPASVDAKAFARAEARCRGGQFLLRVLNEKKGTLSETGDLVAADLTPGKFHDVKGSDLSTMMGDYEKALAAVSDAFGKIEAELSAQSKLDPAARSFTQLKKLSIALDNAKKAAHQQFMPPQPH